MRIYSRRLGTGLAAPIFGSLPLSERTGRKSAKNELQYMPAMRYPVFSSMLFIALSAGMASPACWGADEGAGPSEQIIRTEFGAGKPGTALQVQQRGTLVTAEVCFDQCDYYQWRGAPHSPEAWDFIAAYEYKKGVGSEYESFVSKAKTPALDAARRMTP